MTKHCCEEMAYHADYTCEVHSNPYECPDKIIIFNDNGYGLIIHDGGSSSIGISFCPWCGAEV